MRQRHGHRDGDGGVAVGGTGGPVFPEPGPPRSPVHGTSAGTVSFAGTAHRRNPDFGASATWSALGEGSHELVIEHRSGVSYADWLQVGSDRPLTVNLLGPAGELVATGGALLSGLSVSGIDAAPAAAGTYTVQVVDPLGGAASVEVSVARTVRVR